MVPDIGSNLTAKGRPATARKHSVDLLTQNPGSAESPRFRPWSRSSGNDGSNHRASDSSSSPAHETQPSRMYGAAAAAAAGSGQSKHRHSASLAGPAAHKQKSNGHRPSLSYSNYLQHHFNGARDSPSSIANKLHSPATSSRIASTFTHSQPLPNLPTPSPSSSSSSSSPSHLKKAPSRASRPHTMALSAYQYAAAGKPLIKTWSHKPSTNAAAAGPNGSTNQIPTPANTSISQNTNTNGATQTPASSAATSAQVSTATTPQNATPRRVSTPEIEMIQYLICDSTITDFLRSERDCMLIQEGLEITGYELYIVEQWACDRKLNCVIISYTGNPRHKIVADVISLTHKKQPNPNSPSSPPPSTLFSAGAFAYFEELYSNHAHPKTTDRGIIYVSNLSSFPSNLNLIPVPKGSLDEVRCLFDVNENLKRTGCGGRSVLTLSQPSTATEDKFRQLFKTHENVPIDYAIREIILLVQISLFYFGLLKPHYIDGLLCNETLKAINLWWERYGLLRFHTRATDRSSMSPQTVSGIIGLVTGVRNRIASVLGSSKTPKDPFDVEFFLVSLRQFQKHQHIGRTSRLDNSTMETVYMLTSNKAGVNPGNPDGGMESSTSGDFFGIVKSTMKEVSGKTYVGLADVETLDIGRMKNFLQGNRARYVWLGRGNPRKMLTQYTQITQDLHIPLASLSPSELSNYADSKWGIARRTLPMSKKSSSIYVNGHDDSHRLVTTYGPIPALNPPNISPTLNSVQDSEVPTNSNGKSSYNAPMTVEQIYSITGQYLGYNPPHNSSVSFTKPSTAGTANGQEEANNPAPVKKIEDEDNGDASHLRRSHYNRPKDNSIKPDGDVVHRRDRFKRYIKSGRGHLQQLSHQIQEPFGGHYGEFLTSEQQPNQADAYGVESDYVGESDYYRSEGEDSAIRDSETEVCNCALSDTEFEFDDKLVIKNGNQIVAVDMMLDDVLKRSVSLPDLPSMVNQGFHREPRLSRSSKTKTEERPKFRSRSRSKSRPRHHIRSHDLESPKATKNSLSVASGLYSSPTTASMSSASLISSSSLDSVLSEGSSDNRSKVAHEQVEIWQSYTYKGMDSPEFKLAALRRCQSYGLIEKHLDYVQIPEIEASQLEPNPERLAKSYLVSCALNRKVADSIKEFRREKEEYMHLDDKIRVYARKSLKARVDSMDKNIRLTLQDDVGLKRALDDLEKLTARLQYEARTLDAKIRDVEDTVVTFASKVDSLEERMLEFDQQDFKGSSKTANASNYAGQAVTLPRSRKDKRQTKSQKLSRHRSSGSAGASSSGILRAKVRSQLRVRTSQAPELDTSAILDEPTSAYETISGIKNYLWGSILSFLPASATASPDSPSKPSPSPFPSSDKGSPSTSSSTQLRMSRIRRRHSHSSSNPGFSSSASPSGNNTHSPSVEARSHSRPHSSLHSPVRTHAHFPLHSATSTNRPSFTSTSSPNPRPSLNRGGSSGMESIWESSNPVIASSEEEVGYDTDATGSLSMTASPVLLPSN